VSQTYIFTLPEQRGVLFLVIILFISLVIRIWPLPDLPNNFTYQYAPCDDLDSSNLISSTDQLVQSVKPQKWKLERFDINYARAKDLRRMGFSKLFISKWFDTKQEIGFIKSAEDFRKLTILSKTEKEAVLPYLDFSRYEKHQNYASNKRPKAVLFININQADSTELKALPGIGNRLSKRIHKFRNNLGGFYNTEQLMEVYGIDSQLYTKITPLVFTDQNLGQISVNSSAIKRLQSHPYIDYKKAKAIVRYREMHGRFKILEDLLNVYLLDTTWFNNIEPYLTTD
jgi:competence protein ComEA